MKHDRASSTASWVAAARSAGLLLSPEVQLARDPYGAELAWGAVGELTRFCLRHPGVGRRLLAASGALEAFVLWMQLRTRALDDLLCEFAARQGKQVVLLGAGLDCRALRFRDGLRAVRVFEVDHPATQAKKRAFVTRIGLDAHRRLRFVPWDFERSELARLPAVLEAAGLDLDAPTLTLWEGVTMYLTEPAIDASLSAITAYSGRGSWLAMTYLDRRVVERPRGEAKLTAKLVSGVGEPYRFGFAPEALPAWLEARGLQLLRDESDAALALRLLPEPMRGRFARGQRVISRWPRSRGRRAFRSRTSSGYTPCR